MADMLIGPLVEAYTTSKQQAEMLGQKTGPGHIPPRPDQAALRPPFSQKNNNTDQDFKGRANASKALDYNYSKNNDTDRPGVRDQSSGFASRIINQNVLIQAQEAFYAASKLNAPEKTQYKQASKAYLNIRDGIDKNQFSRYDGNNKKIELLEPRGKSIDLEA